MQIRLSVDLRELFDAAARMALDARLPEFAAKTIEAAAHDLAEQHARSKIGNGGFGQELADGVRTRSENGEVTIDHVTNETNHLAEHVEKGGVIRPRNSRFLAIPIDRSVRGEYARVHAWATPTGRPIVVRRRTDGPAGRAYLAEPRGKTGKLRFLYVLARQTKPQKPRPWWPTDAEFSALTERETQWWLDHSLAGIGTK